MNSIQVIESASNRMAVIDLESKLLQNNIVMMTDPIDTESVTAYQAELIYLTDKIKDKTKNTIKIYINSPGGDIYSCFGLYDVIQHYIKQGYIIETINVGLAASAAAIILLSGSKGHRFSMPNCSVLLHQPSSGTYGTITDMMIDLKEGERLKKKLNEIVEKKASPELINMMERDMWLSAEEALKMNVIDKIL